MANNRMALVCTACAPDDGCRFPLAKYYPSQGWYINREEEGVAAFGADLERWLDEHQHGSLFGDEIILVKETDAPDVKHTLLRALSGGKDGAEG